MFRASRIKTNYCLRVTTVCCLLASSVHSNAQDFCLSDLELKTVLIGVFLYGAWQGLRLCHESYPDLKPLVQKTADIFQETYQNEIAAVADAGDVVFERLYPERGAAMRNQNNVIANQQGAQTVKRYSHDQCSNYIKGVEAMAVADNWELVAAVPATMTFQQERARIPRCK